MEATAELRDLIQLPLLRRLLIIEHFLESGSLILSNEDAEEPGGDFRTPLERWNSKLPVKSSSNQSY